MNDIRYEPMFGDQTLFDDGPDDAEMVAIYALRLKRWYKLQDGECYLSTNKEQSWKRCRNGYPGFPFLAMRRIIKTPVQHSDDVAVDLFAAKMKEKLEKSRDKGRSGWESCPIEHLIASLKDHISKGDPVDVANFAMMISQRGESIKTPVWTETDRRSKKLPEIGCRVNFCHKLNSNWRTGEIKYIDDQVTVIKADDIDRPFVYEVERVEFKPIETPEEMAARLREEWCIKALSSCSILSGMQKYELKRLGGYIEDIYDALLSGDLPVPVKEE